MGKRIKTAVKTWAVVGLIACVILAIVGAGMYFADREYIEYATANGGGYGYASLQAAGDRAYTGQQMMTIAASAAAAIGFSALFLYGYGVLIEESERQTELLTDLLEEQRKANRERNLSPTLPKYQEPQKVQTPDRQGKEPVEAPEERKPRTRRAKVEDQTPICPMCGSHFEGEGSDILPGRKLCMVCDGMVRQFINQTAGEEKQQAKEYLQTCMEMSQDILICDTIKTLLEKNKA